MFLIIIFKIKTQDKLNKESAKQNRAIMNQTKRIKKRLHVRTL